MKEEREEKVWERHTILVVLVKVEAMINEHQSFSGSFKKSFTLLKAEVIQYLMLKETTTVLLTKCNKITNFVEKKSNIIMFLQLWIKKQRLKTGNSSLPSSITCLYTCFRLLLHKIQSVIITFHDEFLRSWSKQSFTITNINYIYIALNEGFQTSLNWRLPKRLFLFQWIPYQFVSLSGFHVLIRTVLMQNFWYFY